MKTGTKIKYISHWYCPSCKFRVSVVEHETIKFNPRCRCWNTTGNTWDDFLPRFINEKGN